MVDQIARGYVLAGNLFLAVLRQHSNFAGTARSGCTTWRTVSLSGNSMGESQGSAPFVTVDASPIRQYDSFLENTETCVCHPRGLPCGNESKLWNWNVTTRLGRDRRSTCSIFVRSRNSKRRSLADNMHGAPNAVSGRRRPSCLER